MKLLRLFVLLSTLLCAVVAPSPARAQAEVSFDFFYDSLAPYGDWIDVGDYGLCWTPNNVDANWTPYSDGYFAYTDGGWTWVSYEDFGGIVYHYGRWLHLDDGRWGWVPGYDWAPSWVSWRHSPDYIGWAPLPPEARWRRDVGISIWVDSTYDIGPGYYHFCRPRDFGAPVLRAVIVDPFQNVAICRETVNITNIAYDPDCAGGPVIFVGGPSFDDVSLVVTRPVPALKLVRNFNFDAAHWREHGGPGGRVAFNAQTVGNQLIVAAPLVVPPRDPAALRSRVQTVIAADHVNKGWNIVKNPAEQNALRQEFRRQSKGVTPETAPAHAVAAADLKGVPAKADPHAVLPGTAERRGREQRPQGIVSQLNNNPPTSGPGASNPVLKPFNGKPESATSTQPGNGGSGHPSSVDRAQQERAAEQARIRAEQQEATKEQAEETRQRQVEQQREMQIQQQQQFQQKQQVQQQQQQQERSTEARRAQELEREREKAEAQHSTQPPSHNNAQVQPRGNQPPPSNNGSPQPNNKGHSKDSKDSKDKDKNNGN